MDVESSIIASQGGLALSALARDPQRQADEALQQQQQQSGTELPASQVVVRQGSPEAFEQADRFREQQQPSYEQPGGNTNPAISAYQALATEQQRSEIQQLLGVDTYA